MNLFELFVKIGADTSEADKGIDETGKKTSGLGEKIKSGLATVGKAAVVGVTAAATAIGTIGTKAIQAYADYEQLVGGVETLFKDSQDKVMEYANNAYKTAGLSANEYMETVTSFSASLLQSLDGDTSAAAEKANLALTDMSDNANKMGTDMTSIQNAYQGFAKANYTMLDNLKLGYGGTQAEMQRLLEDAEKISGIKYDISSYADIVDAIHVVQTEMGITGTTAKEAASTIQGSFGMVKATWQNLVTGLADPNQDLGTLVGNFTDSVVVAGNNLIPRIQELLPRIVEAVSALMGTVSTQLPGILGSTLPSLIEGASNLVTGLMSALPEILTVLGDIAPTAIGILVPALLELLPEIVQTGIDVIASLAQGIADALPELIPAATEAIIKIAETLTDPGNLGNLVDAALAIILALIGGLISAIPDLVQAVPTLIKSIVDTFLGYDWGSIGTNIVDGIKNGFLHMWESLKRTVSDMVNGLVSGVKSILGIASPSKVFAGIGGYMAEGLGQGFDREMLGVRKDIEDQMTFGTTSFSVSGAAKSSVGVVNGLLANNQPGTPMQINLVLDGQTIARAIFDPLRGEIVQRGVSLA